MPSKCIRHYFRMMTTPKAACFKTVFLLFHAIFFSLAGAVLFLCLCRVDVLI